MLAIVHQRTVEQLMQADEDAAAVAALEDSDDDGPPHAPVRFHAERA